MPTANLTALIKTKEMAMPATTYTEAELIQRARDIAADVFVKLEMARADKPTTHSSYSAWGRHIDDYSRFTREGSYDADCAVQTALAALRSVVTVISSTDLQEAA